MDELDYVPLGLPEFLDEPDEALTRGQVKVLEVVDLLTASEPGAWISWSAVYRFGWVHMGRVSENARDWLIRHELLLASRVVDPRDIPGRPVRGPITRDHIMNAASLVSMTHEGVIAHYADRPRYFAPRRLERA